MHDSEQREERLKEKGEERRGQGEEPCGFIFAPFSNSESMPTLLIRPDIVASGWEQIDHACENLKAKQGDRQPGETNDRAGNASPNQTASEDSRGEARGTASEDSRGEHGTPYIDQLEHGDAGSEDASQSPLYGENLERMLGEIRRGTFEKVVLSYCQRNTTHTLLHHEADTFLRALDAYPEAMVYLVYTTTAGRWMGCTPEILLQGGHEEWETMALAGTHEREDAEWDTKNIEEQNVVSQYIKATLQSIGTDVREDGPYTMQAGNLIHRRTDFRFTSRRGISTMDIVGALHPTPAVCGFPKKEALQYLTRHEHSTRNYFSGYLGPVNIYDRTCLYVNLRCAQICSDATYYHAGGGLNRLSVPEEEMLEIERKMETVRALVELERGSCSK